MNRTAKVLLATIAIGALGACAEQPMSLQSPSPTSADAIDPGPFQPRDFIWSTRAGSSAIEGTLTYRAGRYGCEGGDVILTPETAWSRRRMVILYGSASAAAVPVEIVRARNPGAPAGDLARFARKTTCDVANHFRFQGLPEGAWFVITLAKPVDGAGDSVAVTRRVETHGGVRSITLN